MSASDLAGLVLAMGIGGAAGAAAALFVAGTRLADSFARFRRAFETTMASRRDDASRELWAEFEALRADFGLALRAVERLRRALRSR